LHLIEKKKTMRVAVVGETPVTRISTEEHNT
jgi:hypothetical protein